MVLPNIQPVQTSPPAYLYITSETAGVRGHQVAVTPPNPSLSSPPPPRLIPGSDVEWKVRSDRAMRVEKGESDGG